MVSCARACVCACMYVCVCLCVLIARVTNRKRNAVKVLSLYFVKHSECWTSSLTLMCDLSWWLCAAAILYVIQTKSYILTESLNKILAWFYCTLCKSVISSCACVAMEKTNLSPLYRQAHGPVGFINDHWGDFTVSHAQMRSSIRFCTART